MPLQGDVKTALRISASTSAYDSEIDDLIAAAKDDLKLSGVVAEKIMDTDPLIKRAVSTYVKANFGWDNPDADRLQKSYDMLKMHLTLSQEYSAYVVTFTVTHGVNPLENATVTFNGEVLITNTSGAAVFTGVRKAENINYQVTLEGYGVASGDVDVSGSKAVNVTLTAVI